MRILIVGGDAAGMSAASQIRRRQPTWTVEVFEMGERTSYGLCGIPYYVGGLVSNLENLVVMTPEQFERDRGIKVHIRHMVTAVNPARKSVTVKNLADGQSRDENYDQLLLATGAAPLIPAGLEPGVPGLFYIRGLDDAGRIRQAAAHARTAVVVGGGYIGLEVAENLAHDGLKVTLIGRRVANVFEPELQSLAQASLVKGGVNYLPGSEAVGAAAHPDGGVAVKLAGGETVQGDLVVVGAGVRPRSELAAEAGLALGEKKAVQVDRLQRTSNPFIFAAGDCAETHHLVTKKGVYIPLALPANRHGKVAGLNICGQSEKSQPVLGTSALKVFDLGLARTGLGLDEAIKAGFRSAVKTVVKQRSKPGYFPGSGEVTVAVIYDKITGRLLGGQMAGPPDGVGHRINTLAAAITGAMTVKEAAAIETAYAPPFSVVYDPVIIACEVAEKSR
ncbi:hypothetical protein C4J81_08040 [Deltaproteobacteria bacterium Smac51]|nr:hypothetical protein C4J81_08040 [Deltaproteobacteria bacterium Smac51]